MSVLRQCGAVHIIGIKKGNGVNMKKGFICIFVPIIFLTACKSPLESQPEKETELITTLHASWGYNYRDVEELTENSDYIAIVNVKDSKSFYYEILPKTLYTVETTQSIYGETDDVQLVFTGGVFEDKTVELSDDPLMSIGDSFLVFARKNDDGTYTVLSGPQGRFVIEDDCVYSLNAVDKQSRSVNRSSSNIMVDGVPLDDFIESVEGYLSDIHAVAESQAVQSNT